MVGCEGGGGGSDVGPFISQAATNTNNTTIIKVSLESIFLNG
jgi:hypothetical protein